VEVLDELRVATATVEEHRVVMVGLGHGEEDVDPEALCRLPEAVDERVVGDRIGPEQELTLGAPASEEIELTRKDLAGTRHEIAMEQAPRHERTSANHTLHARNVSAGRTR
jgi:hypothetical protein